MLLCMKTTFRALAVLLFTAAVAPAADPVPGKPLDTTFLKQYAETRGFMLGRPQRPKISPDSKTVLFLRADPKTPKLKLFEFDVSTGKTKELLSPEMLLKGAEENLSPEEKARRERQRVSVGGFTDYHFDTDGTHILLSLAGKLYVFDRATAKATELKTGTGAIVDPKWSPDGKKVAYVRGFDVYVYDLATDKESAVTSGGTIIKTHGLAEFVAQEEMGRFSGYWWSPDSKHIAYEEADHTGVETWYVADPLKPDQKPAEQYYPRPGKKNVSVRLGIIPVEGGKTVWVEWNRDEWEYLTQVIWQKYGPLTLKLQDRKQEQVGYYTTDLDTRKVSCLFSLKASSDDWVNLDQTALFWNKHGKALYTRANHPASWRGDGPTLNLQLDMHFEDFDKLVHYDPDTGGALFQSTWHPTRMYVYRLKPGDYTDRVVIGDTVQLTKEFGIHTAAGTDKHPIITSTTPNMMPLTRLLSENGKPLGTLPSMAIEPNFIPNVQFVPNPADPQVSGFKSAFSRFQIAGPEKDEFFAAVVRPQNFDPKKKYPVIVDVYGGPKHLHVVQAMRNWLVPQWLADQGFIVVAIENRGTPGRGRDWERAIYQKFGTVPIEDQVKGLQALCAKFPELDGDRVGIVGWSFGGYMAANGVLRKPEVFKAAVAGAPVTDWEDYDSHYTERYMGLLPESKKAYDDASLIPLAKDLKRPLMLVHGTADDNVYYRHTLKLSDALFRAGKDFETVALPGVTHMYSADPVVMERLWSKTAGFFKTHLGEPK
jgi:dipeptidyl-peptidase 4